MLQPIPHRTGRRPISGCRIVFFGTSEFAVPSLEVLNKFYEIVAVITQPDKPAGRKLKLTPPPVKKKAIELGLEKVIFQPQKIKTPEFYDFFYSLKPDIAVVVAYGKLIPKEIFEFPKYKTLNLHASLLPKYRGASPIRRALLSGEKFTGNTVMLINEGMDTGDILAQEKEMISLEDNYETLSQRLAKKGAFLLLKTIEDWIEKKIQPYPQNDKEATYAPPIEKIEYRICWKAERDSIYDRIRALYPNAYTFVDAKRTKRIKILKAKILEGEVKGYPAGSFYPLKNSLVIVCGDGKLLEIKELISPKGKRISGEAFLRGFSKVNKFFF